RPFKMLIYCRSISSCKRIASRQSLRTKLEGWTSLKDDPEFDLMHLPAVSGFPGDVCIRNHIQEF
ncbi:unnamed protein product, partial [Ceratitis capitata]